MIKRNISKEQALKKVAEDHSSLRNLPDELRNDRDVVLAAVKKNGNALTWASKELRNDREIVLATFDNGAVQKVTSCF